MTGTTPARIAAWPFAARVADFELTPNIWRVLVADRRSVEEVAAIVAAELEGLRERPTVRRQIATARELINLAGEHRNDLLILTGLEQFDERAWRTIDINRTRLEREAPTLVVIDADTVAKIPALAPNLWSWIGDGVWTYQQDTGLTDEAREARLVELRRHFGFDDAELLRRAHSGDLPAEPDIAEWLVLLGESAILSRGDAPP